MKTNKSAPYIHKFLTEEDGTTAIEFGIIFLAFVILVFGVFEAGLAFLTKNAIQYAAEQETRYRIAQEDATNNELLEIVNQSVSDMSVSPTNMTITGPTVSANSAGVNFITISIDYRYQPFIGTLLPDAWSNITLTAVSSMPVR